MSGSAMSSCSPRWSKKKDDDDANAKITIAIPQPPCSPSLRYRYDYEYSFWGVKVSPHEPVTVAFRNSPHRRKRLQINQAVLGEVCDENVQQGKRSVLRVVSTSKRGDNREEDVYVCSLRLKYKEMKALRLVFEPADDSDNENDITFSVKGARGIHLTGFLIHYPAPSIAAPLPQQLICTKHDSFETPDVDFEQKKDAEVDHNRDKDKDALVATNISQPYSPSPVYTANVRNDPHKLVQICQIRSDLIKSD